MIAILIVVLYKRLNSRFQLPGGVLVLQLHHILHRAVIAFNLALGHGMIRCTPGVTHLVFIQIDFKLARQITRAIVAE
jgi:hypothetical protein